MMSGHPTVQDPSTVPEEFDDINDHCALAFDYYESTYGDWLDMKDDFEKYRSALEERYG
jgi:kinetochore protein NDC80